MIQTREKEIIATIQTIRKHFSPKTFERKFVSAINNYLKNNEKISYFNMRNQLDLDFNIDMNPIFLYIINNIPVTDPDIHVYIKVIDKIKFQYGPLLHRIHEAAINPSIQDKSSGLGHLKQATAHKDGKGKYYSNIVPFTKGCLNGNLDNSAVHRSQSLKRRDDKFINDIVKTM